MKILLSLILAISGISASKASDMSQPGIGPGTSVTITTLTATAIGISTSAPIWPLTVTNSGPLGTAVEQNSSGSQALGAFWNRNGTGVVLIRATTEYAGSNGGTASLVTEAVGASPNNLLDMRAASGTWTNRTQIASAGKTLGSIRWQGWTSGNTYSALAQITGWTEGIPGGPTNQPGYMSFMTASTGTAGTTEKVRVTANGSLTVGAFDTGQAMIVAKSSSGNTTTFSAQDSSGNHLLDVLPSGNVGIGTASPASKLHVSSGTFLLDGTANKLKLSGAAGVASSGSGYLDLTNAGYGTIGSEMFIGAVSAGIVGYNTTATHRFYTGTAGAGAMDITSTGLAVQRTASAADLSATYGVTAATLAVSGSTFTVATTGIVSAPSQPGATLYLPGDITLPSGQNNIFWDTTTSNRASYIRQNTVVAGSSNTFTAQGTGLYFVSFCARATTTSGYLYLGFRSSASTTWLLNNAGASVTDETHCATGYISATAGDTYEAYVQGGANVTIAGGLGNTRITFQKVW